MFVKLLMVLWDVYVVQAADEREADLRRSLRDAETKHKQQIRHLDTSVLELQRCNCWQHICIEFAAHALQHRPIREVLHIALYATFVVWIKCCKHHVVDPSAETHCSK